MAKEKLLPIFSYNLSAYVEAYESRGVTRAAIARWCGMPKGHFSDLCNGKISKPGVFTAQRIAMTMNITVDDLLTGNPDRREAIIRKIIYAKKGAGE